MNHLHSSQSDSFNGKFLNETDEEKKQKLSKMRRRKKRKEEEEEKEIEEEEEILIESNSNNQSHKMNSKSSSVNYFNHNFCCCNWSKRRPVRATNLRNNQSNATTTALALFLTKLFISICLLLLLLLDDNVTQATSHINSVWLSKDDSVTDTDQSKPIVISISNDDDNNNNNYNYGKQSDASLNDGNIKQPSSAIDLSQTNRKNILSQTNLHSSGSERRINWSTLLSEHGGAGKTTGAATISSPSQSLYTSSSSLQPAIVSLDQAPNDSGQNSIKRSDSDVTQLSFGRNFNNSDDVTLDPSWIDRSNTTNSQVQFDESGDQSLNGGGINSSGNHNNNNGINTNYMNKGSNNLSNYLRTFRRQDNQTSSLSQQYDAPMTTLQQHNNEDDSHFTLKLPTNSSQPNEQAIMGVEYLSTAQNKSNKKQTTDDNNSPPDIYYIPDGIASFGLNTEDLGASPEPQQIVNYDHEGKGHRQSSGGSGQARRRLHNSGTQYDFRERERAHTATGPTRSNPSLAKHYQPKQSIGSAFNDGEMLAYNGGDEDDENRLKSVTVKHDGSIGNNIDLLGNPDLSPFDSPPFGTTSSSTTTTSDRVKSKMNNNNNFHKPTTPMPAFHHQYTSSPSYAYSPTQPVYPISKYLARNNQISSVPKSRYILQAPPTVPQRTNYVQRQPTPVVSLIAGIGPPPDGVTRQDNNIWSQFSANSKQSNTRNKLNQEPLLIRANPTLNLPILNYIRSPVVPNAPGSHLGVQQVAATASADNENNRKPAKKSLLAALSNRFNNWVDTNRGNSATPSSLENSFYNTNQHQFHVRRMRPQQVVAPTWASSNYYHISDSSEGTGHSADGAHFYNSDNSIRDTSATIRQPPLALLAADHHASLVRPSPIAYYPASYQPSSGSGSLTNNKANYLTSYHPNLLSIQQPTVSPAPNQIDRFYGNSHSHYSPSSKRAHRPYHYSSHPDYHHLYNHRHHNHHHKFAKKPVFGSEPSSASFIPVVAVSVTKTSPAPMSSAVDIPTSDHQHQNEHQQQQTNSAAEIDNYLDMRVGNINRDRRSGNDMSHRHYRPDNEFGNYASGSMKESGNNHRHFMRTVRPATPIHEHSTTTVKSAVFGYLPHQIADNPLLKAVNILPQFTPRVSYSPGHHHHSSHAASASDAFVNHHGEQDAVNPSALSIGSDTQDDNIAPLPIEEPPNLSLQLQANSFVQNDIAHPFMDQHQVGKNHYSLPNTNFDTAAGYHQAGSMAQHIEPIDVYPANQHHLHGFQLFKPGTINSYLSGSQTGPQILTNPLLADSSSSSPVASKSPLLATSSDLNPLMQGFMFANPTNIKFQLNPDHPPHNVNQNGNDDQTASSSTSNTDIMQQDSEDLPKNHQSPLNKGKKRSSEFFANAGQLLLSALPLLLAPTLGLMFASTPNSVARYQGSNPFSSSSNSNGATTSTGIGTVQHSLPSTYINSLNSGSVSNPSPAPVVFTPTPPGYLMTSMVTPTNGVNRSSSSLSRSTKSPQHHTTLAPNISSSNKIRSTTPKVVVSTDTFTTISPPIYLSSNSTTATINRNESSESSSQLVGKHNELNSTLENDSASTIPTTILQDTINSSIILTNNVHSQKDRNHYDIGYEGVDYDAQFASLRKPSWQQNSTLHKIHHSSYETTNDTSTGSSYLDQNTLNLQKPSRLDKNRYQYSEVVVAPQQQQRNKTLSPQVTSYYHQNHMDEVDSKLFPVSTWPTMRRKTVSLVTSNGNKTLLDSSDKYPGLYQPEATTTTQARPVSHSHTSKQKPLPNSINKPYKYTTPSYDDDLDGDDLEDTNLDHLIQDPLNKINTTIKILTKKVNPNSSSYEQINNGTTNYDISSLFDLASEQSSPGNSRVSRRKKRDIERANKLDNNGQQVSANKTRTNTNRPFKSKKVRKVKIKHQQRAASSTTTLNPLFDYNNNTSASGNSINNKQQVNHLMATLESNNSNSIDDDYSNERPTFRQMQLKPINKTSIKDNRFSDDQMKGDASKSKSAHIITTMITHADDEDDQVTDGGGGQLRGRDDYNQVVGDFGVAKEASDLREQLIRKKMILDKIASSSYAPNTQPIMANSYEEQNNSMPYGMGNQGLNNYTTIRSDWLPGTGDYDWQQQQQQEQQRQQNFSYGGRGRLPSPVLNRSSSGPIEVIATKVKLYPDNVTEFGESNPRRKKEGLILNEDTKKALENFGSLLIKDTLKIPKPIQSHSDHMHDDNHPHSTQTSRKHKQRKSFNSNGHETTKYTRGKTNSDDDTYGTFETSSTEPILTQTTSIPTTTFDNNLNNNIDNLDTFPQHRSGNYNLVGPDWHKEQQNYYNPSGNNNNLRATRYVPELHPGSSPRRLYSNRSEDYQGKLGSQHHHDHPHHNYSNHNVGYDSPMIDHHVRPMHDRVSLVENDLPNYAPADDRSTENSYIGSNMAHYSSNDEMKFRQPLSNNQYQRGSHLHTYKSDPTAPINSYSLYTMHHINRSSSINPDTTNHLITEPPQLQLAPNFASTSGLYAPGNHSSSSSGVIPSAAASIIGQNEKRDQLNDHGPTSGYSVSGGSHIYTHSNGHYGPNRRDTPHPHRIPSYQQSSYEPRNRAYQHDFAHNQQLPGNHAYQQQESHQNQEPYQYHTTYAPTAFGQQHHQQPIYHNHKPSDSNQYQQHFHGDYSPQTKGNNNMDLPSSPESTPYSHQQHLPKFYQPSSEIRYPASATNRNQQEMGYVSAARPIDSSVGNVYYPSQLQVQAPPLQQPAHHGNNHALTEQTARMQYTRSNHYQPLDSGQYYSSSGSNSNSNSNLNPNSAASSIPQGLGGPIAAMAANDRGDSRIMNEYFKRVQFSDSDRDKLMAR